MSLGGFVDDRTSYRCASVVALVGGVVAYCFCRAAVRRLRVLLLYVALAWLVVVVVAAAAAGDVELVRPVSVVGVRAQGGSRAALEVRTPHPLRVSWLSHTTPVTTVMARQPHHERGIREPGPVGLLTEVRFPQVAGPLKSRFSPLTALLSGSPFSHGFPVPPVPVIPLGRGGLVLYRRGRERKDPLETTPRVLIVAFYLRPPFRGPVTAWRIQRAI